MTRQEAIENVIDTYRQRNDEFCISTEQARAEAEIFEVLAALGVSQEEMPKEAFGDEKAK